MFEQLPGSHLRGSGCPKCVGKMVTTDDIINECKKVHGDKYDYSLVQYKGSGHKIKIICPEHGLFEQLPGSHLKGVNCSKCAGGVKINTEEFIEKAKKMHNNKYDYSLVEYVKATTKVKIICPEHGVFIQAPSSHLRGNGCAFCSGVGRITTKTFIENAKKVHGNKYDYSLIEYANANTNVKIICPEHGVFEQLPYSHLKGVNCPKCVGGIKIDTKEFIKRANKIHNNKYDYSLVDYINSATKVKIICKEHGVFKQQPGNHIQGQTCPKCSGKGLNKEELINKFKKIHGDKYDYSLVEYNSCNVKIKIKCDEHGVFEQLPGYHLRGSGCPKCGGVYKINTKEFIERANRIHNNKYDYSLVEYKDNKEKIKIICSKHGVFVQPPGNHLSGRGCAKCAGKNKTNEDIIEIFKKIHGNRYDYSLVEYLGTKNRIKIICREHGVFEQMPSDHLNGNGCVVCNVGWTNKALVSYLEQAKEFIYYASVMQLIAITQSNGLFKFLSQEKLKKIQDTRPGSQERIQITTEIINDLKTKTEEELEPTEIGTEEITETEVTDILTPEQEDESTTSETTDVQIKRLKGLDNTIITASLDDERIKFMIDDSVNSLWYNLLNKKLDINKIKEVELINSIPNTIKTLFLDELEMANKLTTPKGWCYKYEPLLMQKLISHRLLINKRYGNWSGVGAGKTIGAILAGRHVEAKNTLIITFNSTIGHEDKRGWTKEIKDSFPNSKIYTKINKSIRFNNNCYNYLILNYETFQQKGSANYVIDLLEKNKFDYIILDEVQSIKQREEKNESTRREVITGLVDKVKQLNPDYYLMAMSATPVINNLNEAKSLIELITRKKLDDIDTRATIPNCSELFRRLTSHGIRHKNIEDNILRNNRHTLIEINGDDLYEEALLIDKDDVTAKEVLVLQKKLDAIVPYINTSKGKCVIYTHYVEQMEDRIYDYLTNLGFKVGVYTGSVGKLSREEAISDFIEGKYDVLLGSRPIATGVDGLQFVADREIVLSLPWTNAEMQQLEGRVNRKGSAFVLTGIDVIIPLVSINGSKKSFNWDRHKYNTIMHKATIANAAVDGIIPDTLMPPREILVIQASDAMDEWIERLKSGNILTVDREELYVELYPTITDEQTRIQRALSDFSEMNKKWSTSNSNNTSTRLKENPDEWKRYHYLYSESRKTWDEIPFIEIAKKIKGRPEWIVGDFGCGENLLAKEITNKVHSFDHVAIDETVTACDIKKTPLNDAVLDVAVFSLSLMGSNSEDYLKEAYRTLKPYGNIFICEPAGKWNGKEEELKQMLENVGFKCFNAIKNTEKFIYIDGVKY